MRFRDNDQRLQLDKWYDRIFAAAGYGGGIGNELSGSFMAAGIRESEMLWEPSEGLRLDGDQALWIWAHGNRHRDAIAAGADEMMSPTRLAALLRSIDRASTGHIVVWTCFGGFPGGFAEHLARFMGNGGYAGLRFWGAFGLTSHLERSDDGNQWANVMVMRDREVARLGLVVPATPRSPVGQMALRRPATRDDLNGWGPGLMRPLMSAGLTV